jgi:hypothetical protein
MLMLQEISACMSEWFDFGRSVFDSGVVVMWWLGGAEIQCSFCIAVRVLDSTSIPE